MSENELRPGNQTQAGAGVGVRHKTAAPGGAPGCEHCSRAHSCGMKRVLGSRVQRRIGRSIFSLTFLKESESRADQVPAG